MRHRRHRGHRNAKRYIFVHRNSRPHPRPHHSLVGKGRKRILRKRGKGILGNLFGNIPVLGDVIKTMF